MKDNSIRNKLLNTFLNLIKIDEIYTQESEIVKYVVAHLEELDVECKTDRFGNIIAYIDGIGDPILLNSHLDTPENAPNLEFEIDGDYIRSTGKSILGADPKSGVAVLLELARHIKDNKISTSPIEMVFTLGEEAGLLGALNLDYSLIKARYGLVLDEDGPCTNVVTKAPGYYRIDASFKGKTVHPRDWKDGINVLSSIGEILTSLKQGEIVDGVTLNIGMLNAGTARNSVAGIAELKAELRSFSTDSLIEQGSHVEKVIEAICKNNNVYVEIDSELEFQSYELKNNHILFQRLKDTYASMNIKPNFYKTYGGSDAAIFNAKGITTVPIGSAYYLAHQYTEYISISDMEELLNFLLGFTKSNLS